MKKLVVVIILLFLASNSFASDTLAKVSRILIIDRTKLIYVYPEGGIATPAACGNNSNGKSYYSFSTTRSLYKEYLSLLLYAHGSGKTVKLYGKNSCSDQPGIETLDYVTVLSN